jgi:integrase
VAALLAACDQRTARGRRDFAIVTLLSRLGLRAGEVAAMQLGDIDWRAGTLTVRGKARRDEKMPLPADAGEAIASYLAGARPAAASRSVFLRSLAPRHGLSAAGVSNIVAAAAGRAGLPRIGAHRLRHSAATAMQGRGVASDATFRRRCEAGGARVPALPGVLLPGRLAAGHAVVAGVPVRSLRLMAGCGIRIGCVR